MLAKVFVERSAEKGDPGVGFEMRGLFARAEVQVGGDSAAAQEKRECHGLLEAIGAEEKMASGSGREARDVQRLRQKRRIKRGGRVGERGEARKKIFPAAKADQPQSDRCGGQANCGLEDGGAVGATEVRESPPCIDDAHGWSRGRQNQSAGLAKTVLQADAKSMFWQRRQVNCGR